MALTRYEEKQLQNNFANRDRKAIRHEVPTETEKPVIDYERLKEICRIKQHPSDMGLVSQEDDHEYFMKNYKKMFAPKKSKVKIPFSISKKGSLSLTSLYTNRTGDPLPYLPAAKQSNTNAKSPLQDEASHNISDHLSKLHKSRKQESEDAMKLDRIATLRKISKKLPFARTAEETDLLCKTLSKYPLIAAQVPFKILKELCVLASTEIWKEPGTTIFGNSGFHMVLKGRVRPQVFPFLLPRGSKEEWERDRPETPELYDDMDELGPGECFGTLEKVEGREPNSRILTVITTEPNCEIFKITASDFSRVIHQIHHRDETEKINLLQSCETFKYWTKQPLIKICDLIEWVSFPANTVIVSEGYKSPFVGVIKSGECHVLQQAEVYKDPSSGRKEKTLKQVVMGTLSASQSFGELSILLDEPITCSIVTATDVHLAVVDGDKLARLDPTTLRLLEHSSEKPLGNLTKDDIYDEYMKQEMKREWNEFKHSVVVDVINTRGIRPGYGKWAKK